MLEQKYQERLDKWRKNTQEVPSSNKVRGEKQTSYSSRKDYADALREFEEKEDEALARALQTNPNNRGYR